jgi:pyruvate kinase
MFQASMRSTKIVATIGPSSQEREVLEAMIVAGMDVARLNFAHGTSEQHAATAAAIRGAAEATGRGRSSASAPSPAAWRSWPAAHAWC